MFLCLLCQIATVYPKKYAHGFVVLCFVVVMQSFIMNSHEVFIHIHQGCFAGTGAIVRLPQCQWSKPDGYGKISQCITTTKHSKAKTVCIFLGIYCNSFKRIHFVGIVGTFRHVIFAINNSVIWYYVYDGSSLRHQLWLCWRRLSHVPVQSVKYGVVSHCTTGVVLWAYHSCI